MKIVFYEAPMSSATPVTWAMGELEVPHERVRFTLSEGRQKQPDFLKINPNGKVPTLVVDGTPLFEAVAILQWLGDRFGVDKNLWPAFDSPSRLEALSWTTWAYVSYGPQLALWNYATSDRLPAEYHNQAQADAARKELTRLQGILDARLAQSGEFLLGQRFSLVDVAVGSVVSYGQYCGVSTEGHTRIADWLGRLTERPAYRAAWS